MWRNSWRRGDWLVQDEESGLVRYASQVRSDWKGLAVTKRFADSEQPQDFVKPLDDPIPVPFMTRVPDVLTVKTSSPTYAGRNMLVRAPFGAASHLFVLDD